MRKAGQQAPDFTIAADDGSMVSLKSLRGRPVVLYFYPKDNTPGCTVEACEFRDAWQRVESTGAVVLGVSPDSVASHAKFRARFRLPFRLLADEDHALADAYGVWGAKKLFGLSFFGVRRTTFVIDAQGKIQKVFEKVRAKGHVAEVLAVLHG
jgi:thioredoxin-dependent peroxiredoxin